MCISIRPATFSSTKIYVGDANLKDKYVHVLAYQNSARSVVYNSPNAMILPFPTKVPMTKENVIDTSSFKTFLNDIAEASQHKAKYLFNGRGLLGSQFRSAQIFKVGSYTVILAENAIQIPDALSQLEPNVRPEISQSLLNSFNEKYPDMPIAVCCWSGTIDPEPLLWWYEPYHKEALFIPTMDSHDGISLDTSHPVKRDHIISVGSAIFMTRKQDNQVYYNSNIPPHIRSLLPNYAFGTRHKAVLPMFKNNDLLVKTADTREDAVHLFDGESYFPMSGYA